MQLLFRALKNWALQVHVAKDNSIVGDGQACASLTWKSWPVYYIYGLALLHLWLFSLLHLWANFITFVVGGFITFVVKSYYIYG